MLHLSNAVPLVASSSSSLPLQDVLTVCMTDPSQDAEVMLSSMQPSLNDDQAAFVFAVRGMLAHGILQHCLTKRHRVDYGVFRCVSAGAEQAVQQSCARVGMAPPPG